MKIILFSSVSLEKVTVSAAVALISIWFFTLLQFELDSIKGRTLPTAEGALEQARPA